MIITYNKAKIVEDENGKKFLQLELQAFSQGTKVVIRNTFPATSNFSPEELLDPSIATEAMLRRTKHE
jgi:hypothetical protein